MSDPVDDFKIQEVRKQFGLENEFKPDKTNDPDDLQLDIKNEAFDQNQIEALESDDHFDELEDFGEISTIALPDEVQFETNSNAEEEILMEGQISDDPKVGKGDTEVSLE